MKDNSGDVDLTKRIEELDSSLVIALDINDKYQRENVALKKRAQEAEGEVTIIKGIGQNSPEMKALQKEVETLKSSRSLDTMDEVAYRELQTENETLKLDLARAKEDHQYDNLVHQKELESVRNPIPKLRNKGLM
tara:strand:+ start:282 stop:686 length:405 start_codon:yes stop_codon:yes gene_type:complete